MPAANSLRTTALFIRQCFQRLCTRSGIGRRRVYSLRHLFGTGLANNGTNQAVIARNMEHSQLQTTSRYIGNSDEASRSR